MRAMSHLHSTLVDPTTRYSLADAIDRKSPLPLYAQVKRRLVAEILEWPTDNDRFFTDQELQAMFKVSRATIRQAMTELEDEGLVRRQQGYGTFVIQRKIEESFAATRDFSGQWAQSGHLLRVAALKVGPTLCPARFAKVLAIDVRTEVLRIERLRMSGDIRIAWDLRFLPMSIARKIPQSSFEQVSLLDVLKPWVRLERGDTQVEAALAGEEYAEQLGIPATAAVLIRDMVYFTPQSAPVFAGMSVYRADHVRYKVSAPLLMTGESLQADYRVLARPKAIA